MLPGLRFFDTAVRVALDGGDPFVDTTSAAHGAATSSRNRLKAPTRAQELAGNYPMGHVSWAGMLLMIENPAHTVREGQDDDGKAWRNVMQAHYGYIRGTRGADGDPVDVFMGPMPESRRAWVINQKNAAGGFDEHKVLVGFHDERAAVDAYRLSYMPGWDRFNPPIAVTLDQLKWWLQWGDLKRELHPEHLPPEPETMETTNTLPRVFWDSAAMPAAGQTIGSVLYALRVDDAASGLLTDPLTLADVYEGAERVMLDALVVQAGRLEPKMKALLRIMEAASNDVKPLAVQISDPVRRYGGVHVAAIFEMSDGQTVTAWFHNPDSTPAKLSISDDLVSWKWQLNKKDITIVVAPEKGADLNLREVARRVTRLVEKNSAAFARINAGRASRMAEIEGLKTTLTGKQAELAGLHRRIEVALIERGEREAAAAAEEAESQARKQKLAGRAAMIVATWKAGDTESAWTLQQEQDQLLGLPGSTKREAFFENMTAMYGGKPAINPIAATMAVGATMPGYAEWEDLLIRLVEERMEADRGDAQGIVEAADLSKGPGTLLKLFQSGYMPETAYTSLFPEEATPEPTPEPTPPVDPEPAQPADVGLEDVTPGAAELLAGNAASLVTAKAIEADVKERGGAVSWSETGQEPAAPVLDSAMLVVDAAFSFNKSLENPALEKRVKLPRYNGQASVFTATSDRDAAKVLMKTMPDVTASEAAQRSKEHAAAAEKCKAEWSKQADDAAQATWGRKFAITDYKISGIGSDAFTDDAKDKLRELAHGEGKHKRLAGAFAELAKALRGQGKGLLDSIFELDGARFVRGDITYRSRPLGSVTINGTGQAFFTNADGSAFNPYMDNEDPEEGAREAADEGIYGWTGNASIVVAALMHESVIDRIAADIDSQVRGAEVNEQDSEQAGDPWPATVLDRDNAHWKLTVNDLDEKVSPGKSSLFGVLRKGGQELNASIVYRGKNAARWYIVLTKPGQRKMVENIPFPTITGNYKLGRIASILMGYLDADEVSGWKIAPPGSDAGNGWTKGLVTAEGLRGLAGSRSIAVDVFNETDYQGERAVIGATLELNGTRATLEWKEGSESYSLRNIGEREGQFDQSHAVLSKLLDKFVTYAGGDRDPVAVRAQSMRRALVAAGWEPADGVQTAGTVEHTVLKRDGDTLLRIKTVQSEGSIMLLLSKMVGGALVADLEMPDDVARTPEDNAKLAANIVAQLKAAEPEPAASPDLAFLQDVIRGAHDALALADLLEKIEASVMGLQEAGQLVGDADKIANEAITRWAELDQKING
jgi:hypothetical protein